MTSPDVCNVPLGNGAEGLAAVNDKREGLIEGFDGGAGGWEALVNFGCGANAQGVGDGKEEQPQDPPPAAAPGGGVWLWERGILVHADSLRAPGLRGERNVEGHREDRGVSGEGGGVKRKVRRACCPASQPRGAHRARE
jgi:hypothetical protein